MTTTVHDPVPVRGLILAGGHSRRMGFDKSALDVHGMPQVRYCSGVLACVLEDVLVAIRPDQRTNPEIEELHAIEDKYADIGPMAGVLSAMQSDPASAWLVLACDLPFVTPDAVSALLRGRDPGRMATAFMATDGYFEPMFAIYEPAMRPYLDECRAAGRHSLREALTNADVRLICAPDDRVLRNINTPEDLAGARAEAATERSTP